MTDFAEPKVTIDLKEYDSLKKQIEDSKDENSLSDKELSLAINAIVNGTLRHNLSGELVKLNSDGITVHIDNSPTLSQPFITIRKITKKV